MTNFTDREAIIVDQPEIKLPTTNEIVEQGIKGFEVVYRSLPDRLKEFFRDDHWTRACFIGITPQKAVDYFVKELTSEQLGILKEVIQKEAPFIKFYDLPREADQKGGKAFMGLGMVNTTAAGRVINNNQEYFPPGAISNPEEWMFNNLSKWERGMVDENNEEVIIRYGLLSSFPKWSVTKFIPYIKAVESLNLENLTDDEHNFWTAYRSAGVRSQQDKERLKLIIKKINPLISDREINLIQEAKRVEGSNIIGYIGFNEEKDTEYIQSLEKVYQDSGIDNLAEKLRADLITKSGDL